jgi:hypothetical protein
MRSIILRDDDTGFFTHPSMLEQIYGPLWAAGIPVCLAVIPAHDGAIQIPDADGRLTFDPNVPTRFQGQRQQYRISRNADLCEFLNTLARQGLIEVCLHGYTHTWREFDIQDFDQARQKLRDGLDILGETLPDACIRTFIPPYEVISPTARQACLETGLNVVCHEDLILSGNQMRIPFAPCADLIAQPLDWLGQLETPQSAPIVGVQHLYQFFEDYGDVRTDRAAHWQQVASRLIAHHKSHITTFARLARSVEG